MSPASAARGHVFGKAFKPAAPHELQEPTGVAVNESTGNIYVADKGNNRVEWFNQAGGFEGEVNGPSATGKGIPTAGSPLIEAALAETGAFSVGEEISGAGLEPHTVIIAIPAPGQLEVFPPAAPTAKTELVALTAEEHFAAPEFIAIDNTCSLHNKSSEEACAAPDHSAGDVYVVSGGVVDKFTATGEYRGQLVGFATPITGVAVDSHGELWVGEVVGADSFSDEEVNQPVGSVPAILDFTDAQGFTVDGEDDLFVHGQGREHEGHVSEFSSSGVLLDEKFDPEAADWMNVELGTGDVYVDHGTSLVRRAPDGSLLETLGTEPGPGKLTAGTGVTVSSGSERVYAAEPAAGEVFEYAGEPANVPRVEGEAASKVTGDSATLEGEVNPRGEPNEEPTTYSFQYITEAAYRHNIALGQVPFAECGAPADPGCLIAPGGTLASDFNVHTLAPVNVQELQAGTTYHFRVVATNSEGTVAGEQSEGREVVHTFTTETAGEFVLPDDRQWELVSPPDKHGAKIQPPGAEVAIQAAAAGSAMTFATASPTESAPQGYSGIVQVLSTRTSAGWGSSDLTIPHETATGAPAGAGSELKVFSATLSRVLVQPFGSFVACTSAEGAAQPCLSPQASEQTPFLLEDTTGTYTPLVSGCPLAPAPCAPAVREAADVKAGTVFGIRSSDSATLGPQFLDATPDLSHVLLDSSVALTPEGGNLYEWSAGKPAAERLESVSILPEDEGGSAAGSGYIGEHSENLRHAISDDGTRVFWATGNSTKPAPLYVRSLVPGHEESLRVNPAHGVNTGNGEFEDASSEGSNVFYEEGGGLYECAIAEVAGKLACTTTDLGSGVESEGAIPGISEDGSYVYFVSSEAKPSTTLQGPEGVEGLPNLYAYHAAATRLVSTLSGADSPDWANGSDLTNLTARVSPDGRHLAFMSQRDLTGYDNLDALSGRADEEVYLYHAPESLVAGAGTLTCASCDPSGARPVGEEGQQVSIITNRAIAGGDAWRGSGSWLAASIPGWEPYAGITRTVYQPRYLSNSGRLFFNARDSLVPQAGNGNWDVYEYEPEGVPATAQACSPASVSGSEAFKPGGTFQVPAEGGVPAHEVEEGPGCVALISSGESNQESAFLDASEGAGEGEHGAPGSEAGGEVFFMTTAKLSKQDTDNAYDVYDAHECTSASPCFPPAAEALPPCSTEASCKAAPETQPSIFGAGPSETFTGAGNPAPMTLAVVKSKALTRAQKLAAALKVCKRDKTKAKRQSCEKQARSKYGPFKQKKAKKTAKKSSTNRRTSR